MSRQVIIEVPDGMKLIETSRGHWDLQKVDRPKSWAEYLESLSNWKGNTYCHTCTLEPGIESFARLVCLRNAWVDGWVPDWCDPKEIKWGIKYNDGQFRIGQYCTLSVSMSFPTREMAEEFLETFEELLKNAQNLI